MSVRVAKRIIDSIKTKGGWMKEDCSNANIHMRGDVCFKKREFGFIYFRLDDKDEYYMLLRGKYDPRTLHFEEIKDNRDFKNIFDDFIQTYPECKYSYDYD